MKLRFFNHRLGVIRCPHCREIVAPLRIRKRRYGSPLRSCPYCDEVFVDKDRMEPALAPKGFASVPLGLFIIIITVIINLVADVYFFVITNDIDIGLVGVFNTIYLAITQNPDKAFTSVLFLALSLFFIIRSLSYRPTPKEVKKSKERLSNPRYVLALDEAGYDVPRDLLDKASTQLMYGYENDNDPLKQLINNISK